MRKEKGKRKKGGKGERFTCHLFLYFSNIPHKGKGAFLGLPLRQKKRSSGRG